MLLDHESYRIENFRKIILQQLDFYLLITNIMIMRYLKSLMWLYKIITNVTLVS